MFFEFFICYCYPAQDLTDEADKLSESIYSSRWYDYPIYQKDVLMLTGKTQIQVIFTVGGILKLDLPTGMAAIKTMFSYSMFLRTMTMIN
ncbi:unnamed protein product [Acanthoscelides obtectus]|uniref:Uncharacterized protein n=1 Tax=Acanthoscelides obtectus TaxID=200917 RepID=A0A9P0M897_ACAOB|nr:unnamed protein product [Acanthoscelides obtectus]CAK1670849.1 hypothetical protein AOBTE_LOCUS27872 [Acanthoscelides obtectus]